jgi:hypothetical protein
MILPSIEPGFQLSIPAGTPCFYCAGLVLDVCIQWRGEGEIMLHPACAVDLCLRILRDVHEVECRQQLGVALTRAASR